MVCILALFIPMGLVAVVFESIMEVIDHRKYIKEAIRQRGEKYHFT